MVEHDRRVRGVLEKAREVCLKLNRSKWHYCVQSLTYMGEKLSIIGVQLDPTKVAARVYMPMQSSMKELQRAHGMVNYMGKFIPNLSAKTYALWSLLNADADWQWHHKHDEEQAQLKVTLTEEPALKFFDPCKLTKVSTDASQNRLGVILLQLHTDVWMPVAYASSALTPDERRYAQIEKETLGIVFGCTRFREIVYSRPVIAETDHKPIIAINKKNLRDMTPHLQQIMLKLQQYNLTYKYLPGKYLVVAYALSRAFPDSECATTSHTEEDVTLHLDVLMVRGIPVSEAKWDKIAPATSVDPVLQTVVTNIQNWMIQPLLCHPYDGFQDGLTVIDGVIVKGFKVVVPTSLRSDMLKRIHEGHLGIVKCVDVPTGICTVQT